MGGGLLLCEGSNGYAVFAFYVNCCARVAILGQIFKLVIIISNCLRCYYLGKDVFLLIAEG